MSEKAEKQLDEMKYRLTNIVTELMAYRALGTLDELMRIVEFADQAANLLNRETLSLITVRANEHLKEVDTEIYLNKQMGEVWINGTLDPK